MATPKSPFDSGKTLVFKSKRSNLYLNSSPGESSRSKSVFLEDSMDINKHPGCHWKAIRQKDGTYSGTYRFETISDSKDRRYLDSKPSARDDETVYLKDKSAGGGSYWTPVPLSGILYSLESHAPDGKKRILSSSKQSKKEKTVYLSDNNDDVGTHWMVGVDYYTAEEVKDIINSVYGENCDVTINYYLEDAKYRSLDYDDLHDIWKDSKLGDDYKWTNHKFDSNDFAVCMKAEVSKYSYKQKLPDDKGSLCGIMWARDAKGASHGFNFTIDPFGNLIHFEPQSGKRFSQSDYDYTPYFCMI